MNYLGLGIKDTLSLVQQPDRVVQKGSNVSEAH